MQSGSSTATKMRIAALAGQVLPLVQANPEMAYAAAISKMLNPSTGHESWSLENQVGSALRYLQDNGMLTSEKVAHPKGHVGTKVKRYAPTLMGAFMISLTAQKKAA